jgi:hypothetical protein
MDGLPYFIEHVDEFFEEKGHNELLRRLKVVNTYYMGTRGLLRIDGKYWDDGSNYLKPYLGRWLLCLRALSSSGVRGVLVELCHLGA